MSPLEQQLPLVLLVEDEILIRLVTAEGLGYLGYHVVEAGSAREALARLAETGDGFAAAVVDVGLPDGKGDDLVETIRKDFARLPIILASGYGDGGLRARFGKDPLVRILPKPYQPEDIDALLKLLQAVPQT